MSKIAVMNTLILAATMVMVAVILVAGRDTAAEVPPELAVGQPAPETFIANRSTEPIEDEEQTQAARDDARANVLTVYSNDKPDGPEHNRVMQFRKMATPQHAPTTPLDNLDLPPAYHTAKMWVIARPRARAESSFLKGPGSYLGPPGAP